MDTSSDFEAQPRRGKRRKRLSLKAKESGFNLSILSQSSAGSENDSNTEEVSQEEISKPSVLHENTDVNGGQLYKFQTRKTRKDIFEKANQVLLQNIPKTPSHVRNNLKKRVTKKILETNDDDSDLDFSDSGSEFVASESSSDSDDEKEIEKIPSKKSVKPNISTMTKKTKSRVDVKKYTFKTDEYFVNNISKSLTSNHTLDKLETPRLPQDYLHKLLKNIKISDEHQTCMEKLFESNRNNFTKWLFLLHENVNILLYGLGSKIKILNAFHEEVLEDLPVIVINGFFPSLTIKDILDGIIVDLLELKEYPTNIYEACDLIEEEFKYIPDCHLYLIVHNIDMIKIAKAQSVLSRLAAVNNIHLIASIDHINAPLIWDQNKLSKFKFVWWDSTSFQNYIDEISFESSMMVQKSGNLALSSLRNVFLSLTTNARGIYMVLVKYQLEHSKDQYYQGLAFRDLYAMCREAFLVSSDLALRTQLTEFIDHKMIKSKRSSDGTENLIIPLQTNILQQFFDEQS